VIAQKTPLVVMNAGADGLTQRQRSPYIFRTSFSNSDSSHPLGEWAYKQGYRKMVLMGADFVAAYEHMGGIARTFTEAGGQVIQEIYPPFGNADFAPFLSQIRRDADVVATFFAGVDAIRFVKQYEEYGLKGKIPLIGKGLTQGDVLSKIGEPAVGIVSAIHWVPAVDTPENKRFMEAYAARYKRPAVDMAEQGYVGAQAIARALEAVKGNVEDQAAFLAALKAVEFNGPRGRVRFDAFQNVVHTVHILKVEQRGGAVENLPIASFPNTTQFWKWSPEAFMALTPYAELRGKWAK
jgi:branched-chain amino acid transport system substrate-binding protein